jgi:alkylhydroperoxidase/carboxymuconolactone decarboxylase family protein YurZ
VPHPEPPTINSDRGGQTVSASHHSTSPQVDGPNADRRAALRAAFIAEHGFWPPVFSAILEADPDFFAAYAEFYSVPIRHGALAGKVREFIQIAVNASATHLHPDATRAHIRGALRLGATREEIMEVLEMASTIGIHTCTMAAPMLLEELERAGRDAGSGA